MNTAKIINFENPQTKHINIITDTFLSSIKNKNTNNQYMSQIKRFFDVEDLKHITSTMIKETKTNTVIEYMNKLTKDSDHPYQNANQFKSALSKYFRYIIEDGHESNNHIITFNPFDTEAVKTYLKSIKEKDVNNVRFEDINMLDENIPSLIIDEINNTDVHMYKKMRDILIVNIIRQTGMRGASLLKLKLSDVIEYEGKYFVQIKKAKGNKNLFTNVSKKLYNDIIEYSSVFKLNENDQIIRTYSGDALKDTKSLREMIAKYEDILKNKNLINENSKLTPHKIREIEITRRVKDDKWNLHDVSRFAGHSNVETTLRYFNALSQFEDTKNSDMF